MIDEISSRSDNPSMSIKKVIVNSGASPEGPKHINDRLSDRRAAAIIAHLKRSAGFSDSMIFVVSPGVDWDGLSEIIKQSDKVPDKEAVLAILNSKEFGDDDIARRKKLESLNGGKPYRWLYANLFPLVRHSHATITYLGKTFQKVHLDTLPHISHSRQVEAPYTPLTYPPMQERATATSTKSDKGLYMSIQTNLLYDALATPNIGVEFYLGGRLSLDANWMYAWWHSDPLNYYWRIYGGDLAFRWWFGRSAKEKPLTGHHIGLHGGLFTYDFELGKGGQIGGVPGGTLWDRANYAAGLEYGYSLPVARRLNLDFTLGVGYLFGEYQEYIPQDDCYVWQATKYRNWIGPTKAEISLVWLIGKYNYNKGKGGKR